MGKGFALTDVDFYITRNKLLLEEKIYVDNNVDNNVGYIGVGQCISFKEIVSEVFPNLQLLIICISKDDYFISDFASINCYNTKVVKGWGKMVPFEVNKISLSELISLLNN